MRIGKPSGRTYHLDLAKARSRLRGSSLGFPYPHLINGIDSLCLLPRGLSGTGCLVFPFVLLLIYVSNYDVTTQSAKFPATSEGCRDVKENIIGIFLFKMPIPMRYEKNNQVPVVNPEYENQEWPLVPDRKISVEGDMLWHNPNRGVSRGLDVKACRPRLIFSDLEREVILDSFSRWILTIKCILLAFLLLFWRLTHLYAIPTRG